jgi:hypothetical protein
VYLDFRHIYDSVLAVRTAEEKAEQIERTKKDIETLKAESEQQGEALYEVEPGKSKKNKKNKKKAEAESEAESTSAATQSSEPQVESQPEPQQQPEPTEDVKDENVSESEQDSALLNSTRKEDNDEA